MVILGGGAAIVVDGNNHCTLTAIGRDRAGDVVGFTGSQCGGLGAPVAVSGKDGAVGTVVAVHGDLRYEVIKFDEPELIPVSDYAGVVLNGIGPDPGFDSLVCKYGPATPGICERVINDSGSRMTMRGQFDAGDVGAPVTTLDRGLVGLACGGAVTMSGKYRPSNGLTYFVRFSAILADVNSGDGPGSGFVLAGS